MSKRNKMSQLEDEIREEYRDFSCVEMFSEVERLRSAEANGENILRSAILFEMIKDSNCMDDIFD